MVRTETENCTKCKFFTSFADDYCDYTEPVDQGFCKNGKSPFHFNNGASIENVCDFFEIQDIELIELKSSVTISISCSSWR
jgi:hypothetical protein